MTAGCGGRERGGPPRAKAAASCMSSRRAGWGRGPRGPRPKGGSCGGPLIECGGPRFLPDILPIGSEAEKIQVPAVTV